MADTLKWLWLSLRCGAGNSAYDTLLRRFGNVSGIYAYNGNYASLGVHPKTAAKLSDKHLEDAMSVLDFCTVNSISILTIDSPSYPKRLKRLQNPPVVLYYMGSLPNFDERLCLAVVGTRDMTDYGNRVAGDISYCLSSAGAIIVSGMARGIDGVAAAAAIEAHGQTVAVLGSGLDIVYPPEHKGLMHSIIKNGAVISEYPPGTPPERRNFPMRNRIISGLCQGTVVIEGDSTSGSLITADNARRQGRDIFAVPGMVGEITAQGTNWLIKNGASAVTDALDILSKYEKYYPDTIDISKVICRRKEKSKLFSVKNIVNAFKPKSAEKSGTEENQTEKQNAAVPTSKEISEQTQKILETLDSDTVAVYRALKDLGTASSDRLSEFCPDPASLMSALTMLEINGLIKAIPGGAYICT